MKIDLEYFRPILGERESDNIYSRDDNPLALGYYQFTRETLTALQNKYGLPAWQSDRYFLTHNDLQDIYYRANVNDLLQSIEAGNLDRFIGQNLQSVQEGSEIINLYGLIGGAWLGGYPGLKALLVDKEDRSDGKTYVSDYVVYFSRMTKNYNDNQILAGAGSGLISLFLILGAGLFIGSEIYKNFVK